MGFLGSGLKDKIGMLASQQAPAQGPQASYAPPPGLFGSRRFDPFANRRPSEIEAAARNGTLDPTRALHNQLAQSADAAVGPAPMGIVAGEHARPKPRSAFDIPMGDPRLDEGGETGAPDSRECY